MAEGAMRTVTKSLFLLPILAMACGGAAKSSSEPATPAYAESGGAPAQPGAMGPSDSASREEAPSAGSILPAPPPPPMSGPSPTTTPPSRVAAEPATPRTPAPDSRAPTGGAPRPAATSPPVAAPTATAPRAILPPPSGVRAGEWDDNANYREFLRYLETESNLAFHKVDLQDRAFLVVRDSDGKGVPRCRVTVNDARQHTATLTTTASGRAILFPHAEGLVGNELTATTVCQGVSARAGVPLGGDGVVDLRLPQKRALPQTRTVDVAFILDTTGSMGEEIAAVKHTIEKVTQGLSGTNVRVRIGMVEFKDRGDAFVTRVHAMTTDLQRFSGDVAAVSASGGGDTPESVNEGVHVGIHGLEWGKDSIARLAFLIGDAPPHLDYARDFDYATEMKDAAHEGIQLYTIAASGMDGVGQVIWRQMAQYTGASDMFVLRGGAGPQSTGGGDPKSSCGGTQTSYASGNLDALILAKVRGAVKSLDRDPMRIAGVGKDENAKACEDRVLMLD
jgi:von Willebrand factor type A domain